MPAGRTEFETFFEDIFNPLLDKLARYDSGVVFSDGGTINEASWDRKAAYLVWMISQGMDAPE